MIAAILLGTGLRPTFVVDCHVTVVAGAFHLSVN
jgi:hypothetical protein